MDDDIGIGEMLIDNALGIIGALMLIWAVVFVCVGVRQLTTETEDDGRTPSNNN